jgi:hypothetical protein
VSPAMSMPGLEVAFAQFGGGEDEIVQVRVQVALHGEEGDDAHAAPGRLMV